MPKGVYCRKKPSLRVIKQRAKRKTAYNKVWIDTHPEVVKEYDKKYLKSRATANSERRRKLRREGIAKLGGRCSSPNCRWESEDGSKGCTDYRILQFDHVKGGGTKERKQLSFEALCKKVLEDTKDEYQLLCANCNWIKAFENREFNFKYEMSNQ